MVLCIDCKHFRITSRIEGDMCDRLNEILSDNLVYDDLPCVFYEPLDDDNTENERN